MTRMTDDEIQTAEWILRQHDLVPIVYEVMEALKAERARVAELEQALADEETFASHAVQDKRYEAERAEAAEAQLAALREENQYLKEIYVDLGLHDSACRIDKDGECDCWHERFAAELQSLLTDNTPAVNSTEAVNKETPNGN